MITDHQTRDSAPLQSHPKSETEQTHTVRDFFSLACAETSNKAFATHKAIFNDLLDTLSPTEKRPLLIALINEGIRHAHQNNAPTQERIQSLALTDILLFQTKPTPEAPDLSPLTDLIYPHGSRDPALQTKAKETLALATQKFPQAITPEIALTIKGSNKANGLEKLDPLKAFTKRNLERANYLNALPHRML